MNGIKYEKTGTWYEMDLFQEELEAWEDNLVPATHSIYDHIEYDSAVEETFAKGLEGQADVQMYVKLPDWFKISTPIGEYNPDWAIVKGGVDKHGNPTKNKKLYFVCETKGSKDRTKLRASEDQKIHCGERHFKDTLGTDYFVAGSVTDLPPSP